MSEKIDVILIDPFLKTIIKTQITGDLESLQHAIGDHNIELVYVDKNNILYVDEEGLFRDNQHFFVLDAYNRKMSLAGKAVILGDDMVNGESISTKLSVTDVYKMIEFKTISEIKADRQIG